MPTNYSDPWTVWNQTYTITYAGTSATVNNDWVWSNWNQSVTTAGNTTTLYRPAEPTDAERRMAAAVQADQAARAAEIYQRRQAARDRAEELLLSLLNAEQEHDYRTNRFFTVVSDKGRTFRIRCAGHTGNIEMLVDGRPVASLCCHPPEHLPDADHWVAQKLALETDEEDFCRIANISSVVAGGADMVRPARQPQQRDQVRGRLPYAARVA